MLLGKKTRPVLPQRFAYLPVSSPALDGEQTELDVEKSVSLRPSAAILSRCGVE